MASQPKFCLHIDFSFKGVNVAPDWKEQFFNCAKTIIGLGGTVIVSCGNGIPPKELCSIQEFENHFKENP